MLRAENEKQKKENQICIGQLLQKYVEIIYSTSTEILGLLVFDSIKQRILRPGTLET